MFRRVLFRIAIFAAGILSIWTQPAPANTYANWKARVFTPEEQNDPAISGQLAPSPAGDGIPNLLKYAFDVDPHVDGSLALPRIDFAQIEDPVTNTIRSYPRITFNVSPADYPADLYFVPEFSSDLQTWIRGDAVFAPPDEYPPGAPGDALLISYRLLSELPVVQRTFLRIRVMEGQTLPEDWQMANFGHTGVDPTGDADADGLTNFDEFLHGTDPNDYYNGHTPELQIVSGDGQR